MTNACQLSSSSSLSRTTTSSPTPFILTLLRAPSCLPSHPRSHIEILQRIRRASPTTQYALLLLFFELCLHFWVH